MLGSWKRLHLLGLHTVLFLTITGTGRAYTTRHDIEGFRLPYDETFVARHEITPEEGLAALSEAYAHMGVKYVWGGETKKGIDCSGLILQSYRKVFPDMLMQSWDCQAAPDATALDLYYYDTIPLTLDQVRPGDLVFMTNGRIKVSHVIMVKSIKGKSVTFINATTRFGKVVEETWRISDEEWSKAFVGAGRLIVIPGNIPL